MEKKAIIVSLNQGDDTGENQLAHCARKGLEKGNLLAPFLGLLYSCSYTLKGCHYFSHFFCYSYISYLFSLLFNSGILPPFSF